MNRSILSLLLVTATLVAAEAPQARTSTASMKGSNVPEAIQELLELSLKNGKGLMFHLGSQSVGGAVTKIGDTTVEIRNREYSRIVLRLDRIDGVAMN
jgi:hypothetical protein